MDDDRKNDDLPDEQDLLRGRPFDLAEAIGRQSAGALKGASPVPAHDQTLFAVESLLESDLADPDGSLTRTILARLDDDAPLLARHHEDPRGALREYLGHILASATMLTDLVRAADARWGREYQERPHFERPDAPPHPDDPYTVDQVRELLARLERGLDPESA